MSQTLAERPPLVLVSSCNLPLGGHPHHVAGRKYVDAVRLAGALPLIAPPFEAHELGHLLDSVHGVFLTGSPSNVHPSHFGEAVHDPELPLDPERDAWTLKLIPMALARGLPLLAICRGLQETNVALGGSLHQAMHEVPGHHPHTTPKHLAPEVRYAPAHSAQVVAGGVLDSIIGHRAIEVNSVHGQGVKRLADGLRVEAVAPDGVIEAFSSPASPGFNLCLQWHPEWRAADNAVSMQILQAFGAAVRSYRDRSQTAARAAAT